MSNALSQLQREAQEAQEKEAKAAGISVGLGAWRESLPNGRISDDDVISTYIDAAEAENLASSGALSVVTGEDEDGPGTTPPGTGPDDEETRPDAAGDISQSGDRPEPSGNLWQPPSGSEDDEYEPPSTADMVASPEWVENARKLHKLSGEPDLVPGGPAIGTPERAAYVKQYRSENPLSDEEVARWAKNRISSFNWNTVSTVAEAKNIAGSGNPELAAAFLNLVNMYEHSDGGAAEFGMAVAGVMTDPTTYAGMGVGGVASRAAAKTAAKIGLKKMATRMATTAGTAGAIEGGALGGGFDLVKQNIEQEAGAREDIDIGQTAGATALGMLAGGTLGTAVGYFGGRGIDKLKKAIDDHIDQSLKSTPFDNAATNDPGTLRMSPLHDEFDSTKLDQSVFAARIETDLEKGVKPEIRQVKPSEVYATQSHINTDGFVDDPVFESLEKPVLYEYEGELFIVDGHHRFHRASENANAPLDAYIFKSNKKIEGLPEVSRAESDELAARLAEIDEINSGELTVKAPGQKGSIVTDSTGAKMELVGRTKNGWYRLADKQTGDVKNVRRKQFEVIENPPPSKSGARNLSIFTDDAARIIKMADDVTKSRPLEKKVITHRESQAMADALKEDGIDITTKDLESHWDTASLKFLHETYNSQANALMIMAKKMNRHLKDGGSLRDVDLALFNQAHTKFVATRDLFHGVSSQAARMLNILRAAPRSGVYDFADSTIKAIDVQGGRANTERAIKMFAEAGGRKGKNGTAAVTDASRRVWGNTVGTWILNVRYNMMLSSWRTHFKNLVGNTGSGVYEHLAVSPVRMAVNNVAHAAKYAKSAITGSVPPDPAERLTLKSWGAELRGHLTAARDSLRLAKEIALGNDIGEGKVWNELGLRYNVVGVPDTAFGKLGTTPVRMLEAGDAFFKNQYYNSKIYTMAERKARADEVHKGLDFEERFNEYVNNPDPHMEKEARDFAAKLTYTNDPSVYGTVLGNLARGMQSLQSNSLAFNVLMPFVRTPANLLGYSIDMIGVGHIPLFGRSREILLRGSPQDRQDLIARITVAAGLWAYVHDKYAAGEITGAGPQNWEEKKAWEAAGWQASSMKMFGRWVDFKSLEPAGGALNIIASAHDYLALADWEDQGMGVVGTGLLTLADIIKDESYLSTLTDFLVTIEEKSENRGQSIMASAVNSFLIPNIMRDIRKATDANVRSMASASLADQIIKQWQNAMPGMSDNLPPARDWKGEPKSYYGNVYARGLIPLNVKDVKRTDEASAALAYARIPVDTPSRTMALPGLNQLNLMVMDDGRGFVYDKYIEIMGKARHHAITEAMSRSQWQKFVEEDDIGPGSNGELYLRKAMAIGSKMGRAQMLEFLSENSTIKRGNGQEIEISHPFDKKQYIRYAKDVARGDREADPDENPQYEMRSKKPRPTMFAPN